MNITHNRKDYCNYTHMIHTFTLLPKSSLSMSSLSELSAVLVVGIVAVTQLRDTLELCQGARVVLASMGCGIAFTTANTISRLSQLLKGAS